MNETKELQNIIDVNISEEMKKSYLAYALSVIVSRALPDIRDGLKPVHRRAIYGMHELSLSSNKPHKKSARAVGDIIGKYHPHGDQAVYQTIVRMAQDFIMRYTLVDGQGNFGSVDGDEAAAMRYTEVRLTKIVDEFTKELDNETVNYKPNYDEKEFEPEVLPVSFPNLLVSGTSGIAVGMATNIPPHNLGDVIDCCLAYLENPAIELVDLISIIQGPDFPTGCKIMGVDGIVSMYSTGNGAIIQRGTAEVVAKKTGREYILITEIPYNINKKKLIEKISELSKDKKIEGIADIRDESDKNGIRIVVDVKKDENSHLILNKLYKETPLQTKFNVNMVAIVDGTPKKLNLTMIIKEFIKFRKEVIIRKSIHLLKIARNKKNFLEGLSVALENIDTIIELIKKSSSGGEAKEKILAAEWSAAQASAMISQSLNDEVITLNENGLYKFTPEQAQSILDMRLQKLTGMEISKISSDFEKTLSDISYHTEVISNPDKVISIIKDELLSVRNAYADERRTTVEYNDNGVLDHESLIEEEDRVLTISGAGYFRSQKIEDYAAQNRGGKGKIGAKNKDDDYIENLIIATTKETLLFLTNLGKIYTKKVYSFPTSNRGTRGKPINNILPLSNLEKVTNIIPVDDFENELFLFMVTLRGICKKVSISEFAKVRSNGVNAINLDDGDKVIGMALTSGEDSEEEIFIVTRNGNGVRFSTNQIRSTGRNSRGVIAIRLEDDDYIVSALAVNNESKCLIACENGYGKITPISDFRIANRGGKGVIAINTSERNGKVAGATLVTDEHDIIIATTQGIMIRMNSASIPESGRNTQGARLILLKDEDKISSLASVEVEIA